MRKILRISDFGFRIWGALLAVLLLTMPVSGTTVRKMDLPELVKTADNIVQGRVYAVKVEWEENLAYTYVYLKVDDPLKGGRKSDAVIRQLGGKVGSLNVTVVGMPKFHNGDQVIVFLKGRQDGMFDVVGLNQGKYDIVDDFAVANVSGVTLVDQKTGQLTDGGFVEKAPLEAFKSKIRGLLK